MTSAPGWHKFQRRPPMALVQGAAHQVLHAQGKWKLLEDLDIVDVIKEIGIETILRNFCRFLI